MAEHLPTHASSDYGREPVVKRLRKEGEETKRVEAFSDAVFSVAITLLILEFKVPDMPDAARNSDLFRALLGLWPSFLALIISFLTVLTMWINHHGFFELLDDIDPRLLFANGFLLLTITFVPFPTAVLARYIDSQSANVAAAFYCGTYVVINVGYNLLWYSSAHNRRLIKPDVPDAHLKKIRNAYLLAFPVYVLAVAVSFLTAYGGLAICMALWVLWAKLDYEPSRRGRNVQAQARGSSHDESREK
jgi:uncharacterized membrane protein